MINLAIVEDDIEAANLLEDFLQRYAQANDIKFNIVLFANGLSFLNGYNSNFDIVFMDIELPDLNGMKVAQKLRLIDETVTLIFVTNMAQFAVKGYEVSALDFLVKPVTYSNFSLKIQRALKHININSDNGISVKTDDGVKRISVNNIKYVEVMNHKLIYHTTDGDLQAYGQLVNIENSLCGFGFVRCNSCYLVNLRYVSSIKDFILEMDDDKLQISRARKKIVLQEMAKYLGKHL